MLNLGLKFAELNEMEEWVERAFSKDEICNYCPSAVRLRAQVSEHSLWDFFEAIGI